MKLATNGVGLTFTFMRNVTCVFLEQTLVRHCVMGQNKRYRTQLAFLNKKKKVQASNNQEKAQSDEDSHSKNRGEKENKTKKTQTNKQTDNNILIP